MKIKALEAMGIGSKIEDFIAIWKCYVLFFKRQLQKGGATDENKENFRAATRAAIKYIEYGSYLAHIRFNRCVFCLFFVYFFIILVNIICLFLLGAFLVEYLKMKGKKVTGGVLYGLVLLVYII